MRDCPASNVERWEQQMPDRPKDFVPLPEHVLAKIRDADPAWFAKYAELAALSTR